MDYYPVHPHPNSKEFLAELVQTQKEIYEITSHGRVVVVPDTDVQTIIFPQRDADVLIPDLTDVESVSYETFAGVLHRLTDAIYTSCIRAYPSNYDVRTVEGRVCSFYASALKEPRVGSWVVASSVIGHPPINRFGFLASITAETSVDPGSDEYVREHYNYMGHTTIYTFHTIDGRVFRWENIGLRKLYDRWWLNYIKNGH